jgi:hypothetical protein
VSDQRRENLDAGEREAAASDAAEVAAGDRVALRLARGRIAARVEETET